MRPFNPAAFRTSRRHTHQIGVFNMSSMEVGSMNIATKVFSPSRLLLLGLIAGSAIFAGCAQAPTNDEPRRYCFKALRSSSCVTAPGSSPQEKSAVRTLSPAPGVSRLIVIRHQWPDLQGVAQLSIDGKPVQRMIPASTIAIDLQPGSHVVTVDPTEENGSVSLSTSPGQVLTIELRKTSWSPRRFVVRELDQDAALVAMRDTTILGVFSVDR